VARQLLDPQLLVSNQGPDHQRPLALATASSAFRMRCPGRFNDANTARGDQRRLQRFDVVRKGSRPESMRG